MPANFGWDEALETVVGAAESAFRQVGSLLLARRLHLNKSQSELAAVAGVNQTDISALERGVLPATFRTGNDRVRAVLEALEWRPADTDYMVHMIKEFARY